MFTSFTDFLKWEKATKDTIDVKKVYIDMSEDVMAGIMLSQIVYWYLPSKETGKQKLKIKKLCKKTKQEHFWIAKARAEWYEEIRFSKDNTITAMKKLEKKQIIFRQDNMFDGVKTAHIRLNIPVFLKMLNKYVTDNAEDIPVEEADFYAYLDAEMGNLPEAKGGSALEPHGLSGIQTTHRQESRQPIVGDTDNPSSGIQTPITEITSENSSESTFRESIYLEIENSALPIYLQKILSDRIDRLIEYKIKIADIDLHFAAVKEEYPEGKYGFTLSALIDEMNESPRVFGNVMNSWLANIPSKKKKPIRVEMVPEWKGKQYAEAEMSPEEQAEFERQKAELEAELKKFKGSQR